MGILVGRDGLGNGRKLGRIEEEWDLYIEMELDGSWDGWMDGMEGSLESQPWYRRAPLETLKWKFPFQQSFRVSVTSDASER